MAGPGQLLKERTIMLTAQGVNKNNAKVAYLKSSTLGAKYRNH